MLLNRHRLMQTGGFPYGLDFITGSWALAASGNDDMLITALEYTGESPIHAVSPGIVPATFGVTTFNSGDTPDEIALYFQLPFKFRVTGYWISLDLDAEMVEPGGPDEVRARTDETEL